MDITILEAIDRRRSVRSYIDRKIEIDKLTKLYTLIEEVNQEGSFRFELTTESPEAFSRFRKSYGAFKGVRNYISIIVNKNDPYAMEKIGYYGERLVLESTAMGLGTCWVFLTFDRDSVVSNLSDDENLVGVITLGHHREEFSFNDKFIYKLVGARKLKPLDYFYKSDDELPDWFINGIKALSKAPSAVNARPVVMTFIDGIAKATLARKTKAPQTDLGIAKYHFVVGAGGGSFTWGDGGEYNK